MMSDSKGAAIDELGDILYGIAEECGTFNYDISEAKQAILAILAKEIAQEVNKARKDELKQCRKNSADPTLKKFIGWRIKDLERLG